MIVLVILLGALFLLILGTFIPGIKPEPYYTPNLDDPFSENVSVIKTKKTIIISLASLNRNMGFALIT